MASVWERFGEHIGYGLAAVVLGPQAALERRARRAMRAAMIAFCEPLGPVKLEAPRGILRRRAELRADRGPVALELELDLRKRSAHASLVLERLPNYVAATITKDASTLDPHAAPGPLSVASASLDAAVARALRDVVAAGPLQRVESFSITISPERLEILAVAPKTREEWDALGEGALAIVAWLSGRWPASYRS